MSGATEFLSVLLKVYVIVCNILHSLHFINGRGVVANILRSICEKCLENLRRRYTKALLYALRLFTIPTHKDFLMFNEV